MSKNRRRGNGNTQACVLPRATLGLLLCSAQPIAQAAHRQKQQAFAYCLIPCLLSQFLRTIVRMLSNQARAKNPAANPHARLFGEACSARKRKIKIFRNPHAVWISSCLHDIITQ